MTTITHSKPLVSVILPVFNADKYLSKAILSILNQTITDFELIIIDDGSTDKSLQIIQKFAKKDKRIVVLINPKNIGMSSSINRAIPRTSGKYIARMDADDISLPKRFEKQIKFLESNKSLVAVGGHEAIIDENGKTIAKKFFPTDSKSCYQTLMNFMPIQPPTLMIRGSILRKLQYDINICPQDDINIYFKLLNFGQLGNVNSIIFKYRQINSSLTHSKAKKVYFMALKNRLDGIVNHNYRPSTFRILLAIVETIFVALLPSRYIISFFNFFRNQKDAIISLMVVPTTR